MAKGLEVPFQVHALKQKQGNSSTALFCLQQIH